MTDVIKAYRKLVRKNTAEFIEERLTDEFLSTLLETTSEFKDEVNVIIDSHLKELSKVPKCRLKESTVDKFNRLKENVNGHEIHGAFAVTLIGMSGLSDSEDDNFILDALGGDFSTVTADMADFELIDRQADQGRRAEEIAGLNDLVVEDVEEYLAKRKG